MDKPDMDSTFHIVQEETNHGVVNIAVQGCCHGELDKIYSKIEEVEASTGTKLDLLLICGDFECVRDSVDLCCMAVPPKYRHLKNFYKYFNGERTAPVKTIFIGGNHEASNVLQSLYYGGYVAPNIYFLGWAAVVNFKGLRIGGMSGIYNDKHYTHGHFERPPYTDNTMRSIYHIRAFEVQQMLRFPSPSGEYRTSNRDIDIFLTHDWPAGVWDYGDVNALLTLKPYFRSDMEKGTLGSPPARQLLDHLQPPMWFSGHMHVKFPAVVPHPNTNAANAAAPNRCTRFLALDKVIPGRGYMQFLQVPVAPPVQSSTLTQDISVYEDDELHFDVEWCTIVRLTHQEMKNTRFLYRSLPSAVSVEALIETKELLQREYGPELIIPMQPLSSQSNNGPSSTTEAEESHSLCTICQPPVSHSSSYTPSPIQRLQEGNAQTDRFLRCLGLQHIWTIPYGSIGGGSTQSPPQRPPLPPAPYAAPSSQNNDNNGTSNYTSTNVNAFVPSQVRMNILRGAQPPPPPQPYPTTTDAATVPPVAAVDPNELDI